jgi:hypothetical protein
VDDLALWERNFTTGAVGGPALLAAMQARGRLNSGQETSYASGVQLGRYRGLQTVFHMGAIAGYRAIILRFPAQRFSVTILSNASDADINLLSLRVADLFLAADYTQPPPAGMLEVATPQPIELDPARLDGFVGIYRLGSQSLLRLTREGGQLYAQATGESRRPVFPFAANAVFWRERDRARPSARFTLNQDGNGVLRQYGFEQKAMRLAPEPLSPEQAREYSGRYYSDELEAVYRIAPANGGLRVEHPRGETQLLPLGGQVFSADHPVTVLTFEQDAAGKTSGFTVNNGGVRRLRFSRMAATPAG